MARPVRIEYRGAVYASLNPKPPTPPLPLERYGTRLMGTLSGFGNFIANLGAVSFTYLLGALKDQTGHFSSGSYTITGASVVGIALTFWLEKMRSRTAARV